MVNDIQEEKSLGERNLCVYKRLPRRGPLAYQRFLALLWELREKWMLQEVALLRNSESLIAPFPRKIQAFGGLEARFEATSAPNGQATLGDTSEAELRVAPAKRFKVGDHIYRMARSPRGKCIIINNNEFGDHAQEREASELDVRRMKMLFTALHFECTEHRNLSVSEMEALLSHAACQEEQQEVDCLVVILMSHGIQGEIYGADGHLLNLRHDVFELFSEENCPHLQGKPKLFFVQCSRAGNLHEGESLMRHDTRNGDLRITCSSDDSRTVGWCRRSLWSDMFIAYATVPGYTALKDMVIGSWFLSAVYTVFSEHASTMHLEKLMHLVQSKVMERSSHDGGRQTPNIEYIGWVKKLYFNPGLCDASNPDHRGL